MNHEPRSQIETLRKWQLATVDTGYWILAPLRLGRGGGSNSDLNQEV